MCFFSINYLLFFRSVSKNKKTEGFKGKIFLKAINYALFSKKALTDLLNCRIIFGILPFLII